VYNARLDSNTRQVAFDYQAQVVNRTGEPWHDVALTLSTARPSAGGAAPEALPWVVQEMQRDQFELSSFKVSAARGMADSAAMPLSAPAADMAVAEATVETGLTAANFRIAAPATIPADGTQQKVTIPTLTLP